MGFSIFAAENGVRACPHEEISHADKLAIQSGGLVTMSDFMLVVTI